MRSEATEGEFSVTTMREQVSLAMSGTDGHHGDVLDAVMAVVAGVEQERDEARASVEHLRGDYRRIRKDRDRLLLAWRSARRRANAWRAAATTEIPRWDEDAVVRRLGVLRPDQCGKCGEVNPRLTEALWLHAEAVWQRDQLQVERDEQYAEWEKAASRDMAAREQLAAFRASAVVLPEDWWQQIDAEVGTWGYRSTKLLAELIDSWRPAAVEAAPTHGPDEHEWVPCKRCPNPDQPCACAGGVCCEAQQAEIAAGVSGTGTEASDA